MKTFNTITLNDLIHEDIQIELHSTINKQKSTHNLIAYNHNLNSVMFKKQIDIEELENFAITCRRFLSFYDRAQEITQQIGE